jgi:hypothetical protein
MNGEKIGSLDVISAKMFAPGTDFPNHTVNRDLKQYQLLFIKQRKNGGIQIHRPLKKNLKSRR